MADLILNDPEKSSELASENELNYEFDPNDSAAVERIHALLSLRNKHRIENSEKLLAIFCDKTIDHNNEPEQPTI
ncbi:MAG: hypothetical protein JW915_20720 [Chitinispirillaceae bacterium]|nr:hypothetical protein [Chitinispirillaceae bacterium]